MSLGRYADLVAVFDMEFLHHQLQTLLAAITILFFVKHDE